MRLLRDCCSGRDRGGGCPAAYRVPGPLRSAGTAGGGAGRVRGLHRDTFPRAQTGAAVLREKFPAGDSRWGIGSRGAADRNEPGGRCSPGGTRQPRRIHSGHRALRSPGDTPRRGLPRRGRQRQRGRDDAGVRRGRSRRSRSGPRRTICFVAFDLEERLLYGSRWFAAHPPWDIHQIELFITADMLGRAIGDLPFPRCSSSAASDRTRSAGYSTVCNHRRNWNSRRIGADIVGTRSDYGLPRLPDSVPVLFDRGASGLPTPRTPRAGSTSTRWRGRRTSS